MAFARQIEDLNGQVQVVADMKLGELWDRMVGEFLGEWDRLNRQGLDEDEMSRALESFMNGLSVKPDEKIARTASTVAYNQGRNAELVSARRSGAVQYVVRSEVLDTNTCRPCQLLDGEVFEVGSSEYYSNAPPSQCDGADLCRGFFVGVAA